MAGGRRPGSGLRAVLLGAALLAPAIALAAAANPIAAENALAGDGGWRLRQHAGPGQLEGYASATSVNHGESIDVHASADSAQTLRWVLYRMGWYGGAEGRRIASGGPVNVAPRPTPAPTATGLIECAWPVTFTIRSDPTWASGVYVAVLTRGDGPQSYVVFVVRADERKGAAVVQTSVTTWQAYNYWGGKSLYVGGPAQEVSFDRPYAEGNGSGQYFRYEHSFVTWAESRGLDLVYVTNVDVDRDPSLLIGQRLFLSVGHDEYWSRPARDALDRAIASGVSVAFLSANAVYWQIRLEPGRRSGTPRRTQVCYKKLVAQDPLGTTPFATTRWRDPPVNEPESGLLGVMYTAWLVADASWVVTDSSHWLFEGTGLASGDGIPGIVGYESDRTASSTPPGTDVVARSPVVDVNGRPDWHEATVRTTDTGGFVFASGTIEWAWGLAHPRHGDPRVRRMTGNLFRRAGLEPTLPESCKAAAPLVAPQAGIVRSLWTLAGKPFTEGLQDGPGAEALFRRPTAAAVDAAGNVFVADTGNHAVRMMKNDAARTVVTIAGSGSPGTALGDGGSARLDRPSGIAVGPDGTVYVADTGNQRILTLRSKGGAWSVERLAGAAGDADFRDGDAPRARFQNPGGLTFANGKLYVADRQNNAIRRVDASSGRTDTLAGGGGSGSDDGGSATGKFFFPSDVFASGDSVYVLDAGNRTVRRVSLRSGAVTTVAGSGGGSFDSGGYGDGAAASARFMPTGGVLVDGSDILVADAGNACVRRVRNGMVSTVAGTGAFGARDGGLAAARLAMPTAIERLGAGEWLVVDGGASTLRRLSANDAPPPDPAPEAGGGGGAGGCGCGSGEGAAMLGLLATLALVRGLRRR